MQHLVIMQPGLSGKERDRYSIVLSFKSESKWAVNHLDRKTPIEAHLFERL